MKAAQARRERLFRKGKPSIRPAVYEDIRWLWVAARRGGYKGSPEEFTAKAEPFLAAADKIFFLEDTNKEFESGKGPVGVVLCNYDEWSLFPHVEWFPWTTPQNKLRCTVGFLQAMRYTRDVGIIKIQANAANDKWFKWLKRYVAINLAGRIPHGRADGMESIFYIRGRKQHEFNTRRTETEARQSGSPTASSNADLQDRIGERLNS